ncbi:MAG: amino acid aminotransferase [Bacteroidetes bacterium]|nr:amino acid aminotransferase [Bacteroidota bacterium]
MIKYYSINGELVPKEQASLGITDLAIQRGYGLFDYFVVKRGRPVFFEDYLDRVERSAKWLHLALPVTREELKQQVLQLIRANGEQEAGIKVILTGGYATDGYSPEKSNIVILEMPPPKYPVSKFEQGVKLMSYEHHRTFPSAKSINYIVGIYLLPQQQAAGAEDVLFHFNGEIYETTRANFFIVTEDGIIVTAGDGILHGITRKRLLEVAKQHYTIEERKPTLEELKTAKEAFISSSTRLLMSVIQVDDVIIGDGVPGPITKHLLELMKAEVERYLEEK